MCCPVSAHENLSPLALLANFLNPEGPGGHNQTLLFRKFNTLLSWEYVLFQGLQYDLVPLLWHTLKKHYKLSELSMPDAMNRRFNEIYYQHLAQFLVQSGERERLLGELTGAGIDVILLKGTAVADDLYPSPALRPMSDIDLLLYENDMERGAGIVRDLGYDLYTEQRNRIAAAQRDSHFHLTFIKKVFNSTVVVELHHALARKVFIKDNTLGFWKDARKKTDKNTNLFVASPERLFLHLCWHFFQHVAHDLIFRLIWLVDIILLLKKYGSTLDWDLISRHALEWKMSTRIKLPLFLAEQLFDARFDPPARLLPGTIDRHVFQTVLSSYRGQEPRTITALPLNLLEPSFLFKRIVLNMQARLIILIDWK